MPLGAFRLNSLARFTLTAEITVIRRKVGISAVDNAQVDTAQSKFGGASAVFDGSGDYLLGSNQSFGSDDLTIEFWYRPTSGTATYQLYDGRGHGQTNNSVPVIFQDSSVVKFWTNGSVKITGTTTIASSTWYHVALVRQGNDHKLYINGVQEGATWTSSISYVDHPSFVGIYQPNLTGALNGHLEELRISNTARYTANFTPHTAPHVNDDNTLLLIHADGTDGSTYFEDDNGVRSKVGLTAEGNAQVSTAQSKFGGASAVFDGVDDAIQVQDTQTFNLLHSDAFTIEAWINRNSGGDSFSHLFSNNWWSSAGKQWTLLIDESSLLAFYYSSDGGNSPSLTASTTLFTGTWYHCAVVCDGAGTITLYVNGAQEATAAGVVINDNTLGLPPRIGATASALTGGNYSGYIEELRVSNVARYTANFTPPTEPFVNDDNTLLLIHADGTDGQTVFLDDNGARSKVGVSAIGNTQVDTAQSKFGGASYYGTSEGAYLSIYHDEKWDLNQEQWTIECWFRVTTVTDAIKVILAKRTAVSGWMLHTWDDDLYFNFIDDSGIKLIATGALAANTWYHVAVTKNADTYEMYLDGIFVESETRGLITTNTNNLLVGRDNSNTTRDFDGNIDEVRISNIARYTSNFTPQTEPFSNDENTLLLLHMDGTDGSTVFVDDNGVTPKTIQG